MLAVLLLARTSAATDDAIPAAQLENTDALAAFRTALADQKAGNATHPLRISYFGDSITADDTITDTLRKKLQTIVGDGGAGFVFAGPPHPYCTHRAVSRVLEGDWDLRGISTDGVADHLLGLGGSAETTDGGSIRLVPRGAVQTIDIHYLAQPHGGSLDVACDVEQALSIGVLHDGQVKVWDRETYEEVGALRGHADAVLWAAF